MTSQSKEIDFTIDLATAQRAAEEVRDCLLEWRQRCDIARYEYTHTIRIAPNETPHSHPVLTLNTQLFNPDEILCAYLHEQMHWYATTMGVSEQSLVFEELRRTYPVVPIGFPDGAPDEFSTYLHLLVNWLEIEAASSFLPRDRVRQIAGSRWYYRWIYRTVLADRDALEQLFRRHALAPIIHADEIPQSLLDIADQAIG